MAAQASTTTVSAVIPHLRGPRLLARALRSLRGQELPSHLALEAVVVDNGSRDGSLEVARDLGARTVRLGSNRGVGPALNRGIEAARGEWVALLNNDVELAPDWLATLLEGAVGARAWFATGKIFDAAAPHLLDGAGDAVCRGGTAWRIGHGRPDSAALALARPTYFPAATASLFRRDFFGRAGLFDEKFFAYLEDVELGMRAARLGLEGVYVPEAVAWHRGSQTGGRWSEPTVAWMTRHQILLLARHYSADTLLRLARPVAVAHVLWALLAMARGRFRPWLRGFAAGMHDLLGSELPAARGHDDRVVAALEASEAEIASFQQRAGPDTYWKWYFRLAGPIRNAQG